MNAAMTSSPDRKEAMNAILASNWWAVALRGVLAILFGIIAFLLPGETMLSLVLLFAVFSFVDGVIAIVLAIRGASAGTRWGFLLLNGVLGILIGIGAFLWPAITVLAFVLLVAAWALVSGVTMLISAFTLKASHGRGWLAFGGIASILYGILLVVSPLIGALVLTWWLGAYALVFGIAMLVLAFRLRRHHAVA
ncbi:MAG TPA: HdeD family acid-resistance protein [Geminicoccus sp.]|uniref:HdeD family acid-resistance protein n=1 Tax=Geminicoccus sp. TaxID=2024832 RepID=UPI002E34C005|nr:HdeD family acid-resistance protein [Geminicoccus sp.]HEX2527360.1 HdeD family acid-resistance protein [Geminicoccus sp.]